MSDGRHLHACALVLRQNTEVLLVHREGEAHAALPGYAVERGRSLIAALTQGLQNDLGFGAIVGQYLGAVEYQPVEGDAATYAIHHIFRVEFELPTVPEEVRARQAHLRFGWCPVEGLPGANLQPAPLQRLIGLYLNWDRSPWWATNVTR